MHTFATHIRSRSAPTPRADLPGGVEAQVLRPVLPLGHHLHDQSGRAAHRLLRHRRQGSDHRAHAAAVPDLAHVRRHVPGVRSALSALHHTGRRAGRVAVLAGGTRHRRLWRRLVLDVGAVDIRGRHCGRVLRQV